MGVGFMVDEEERRRIFFDVTFEVLPAATMKNAVF
jgi:hypothetical protein